MFYNQSSPMRKTMHYNGLVSHSWRSYIFHPVPDVVNLSSPLIGTISKYPVEISAEVSFGDQYRRDYSMAFIQI